MKISIIIPVYNIERYIEKCIISCIEQTYKNIEIIIVNDGSKDKSRKICEEYAKKDNRIKLINKENGGLSDARNVGTENAKGDYILYIDGDDYIEKTACEELIDVVKNTKADLICFNANNILENGKLVNNEAYYRYSNTKNIEKISSKQALIDNIYRKSVRYEAWSKLYDINLARKIKFPKGMLAEDFATFYKYILEAKNIVLYDRCLYYYVNRESGSIMSDKNIKLYYDIFSTEVELNKILEKICTEKKDLEKKESNHFRNLIKIYSKFYDVKDEIYENFKKNISKEIKNVKSERLKSKDKFLYYLYCLNKWLLVFGMKKIYKKI